MIRTLGDKTPRIHPTAFVSEAAYVVGDVEIGEGSSIWPGTVIRANKYSIKIGKFVNIQDNCVIHAEDDCTYGDYITVGHHVLCHATTVESNCLIGNGSIVNGWTTIGHHSIVGSGSVVLERVNIPPNSLVLGAPAEVKRQIADRHLQLINKFSNDYYYYGQQFKEAGLEDADREIYTQQGL